MSMYLHLRGRLIRLPLRRKMKTINLQCPNILIVPSKKVEGVQPFQYLAAGPAGPPHPLIAQEVALLNYDRLSCPQASHWVHPPRGEQREEGDIPTPSLRAIWTDCIFPQRTLVLESTCSE